MGETKHHSQAAKTRGHLRLYGGGKNAPRQTGLTHIGRILPALPIPPDQYLDRAQALLDQQAREASSSPPYLMTIAEFAEYCRVSVRKVKAWIRQKQLTSDNGLRTLPDGNHRIDLSIWKQQLRDLIAAALLATHALRCHALVSAILHTMRFAILHGRLA